MMDLGTDKRGTKVEQIQFFALRKHAMAWRVALASLLLIVAFGLELSGQQKSGLSGTGPSVNGTPDDPLRDPRETHLRHVKQLTFGGQNAEAYFSYDGKRLIFQTTREPYKCDQIFIMNADGSDQHLVRPVRAKPLVATSIRTGSISSTPRRTSRPRSVHRVPIIPKATYGGFIQPSRFSMLRTAVRL